MYSRWSIGICMMFYLYLTDLDCLHLYRGSSYWSVSPDIHSIQYWQLEHLQLQRIFSVTSKCRSLTITEYWITIQISSTTPTIEISRIFGELHSQVQLRLMDKQTIISTFPFTRLKVIDDDNEGPRCPNIYETLLILISNYVVVGLATMGPTAAHTALILLMNNNIILVYDSYPCSWATRD